MPMKPTGPPSETAAPVASDALRNARRCVRCTSTPRLAALSSLIDSRFIRRGSTAKARERQRDGRQRRDERRVAADVEIAHQPADRAKRLREVRQELHEQNQRREERVQRDAGEQQHVGRQAAMPRAREPVDDGDGAKRAGEARDGHRRESGDARTTDPNVSASIAPSAAPAETPSVNGVASGLRSSACSTTPGRGQRRADQGAGEHARQPRDEEDLRVGVLGERNRRVEHAPEV